MFVICFFLFCGCGRCSGGVSLCGTPWCGGSCVVPGLCVMSSFSFRNSGHGCLGVRKLFSFRVLGVCVGGERPVRTVPDGTSPVGVSLQVDLHIWNPGN